MRGTRAWEVAFRPLALLSISLGIMLLASCAAPTLSVPVETPALSQEAESVEPASIDPTPVVISIVIPSQEQSVQVAVEVVTLTPVPTLAAVDSAEPNPTVSADAEPVIFTGIGMNQKCGHGDVVALDGHSLRATPRILPGNSNFLELLPEGTRVDIIDCRLWTDQEGLNWLAARTPEKKLGWMLIQPDKFYATLYPVPLAPPAAVTGIPAGTTVAYVPPSECRTGPVSDTAVATSIGVDFIPIVGDLKGLGEAATGCDMVTGESLGNWRWLGLFGLVGLSEVALLRHGDEAASGVRLVDNLEGSLAYSDEVTMTAVRNSDTAADLLRNIDQLDNVADDAADAARALDNTRALSDEAVQALARFEQPCSFSADTLVSTLSGHMPISQIEPGDLILAYDETREATGYYAVTDTFAHLDPTILTITTGTQVVETTPGHPFYVEGEWVTAENLAVGDRLAAASGTVDPIWQVEIAYRPQLMYNLTVAEAHTYFVGPGEWLVHNACSRVLRRNLQSGGAVPAWADEVEWQAHHIIPGQLEDHPFVLRASGPGGRWDIDGAANGIALPKADVDAQRLGLPAHRGPHPTYTTRVQSELNTLEDTALNGGWDNARVAAELRNLVERLRRDILR